MKSKLLAVFILVVGLATVAGATDSSVSTGLLLRQNTSVRAEGMGSVQTAVTTDEAGAMSWNPAALHGQQAPGISAVYYSGIADDSYGALNYDMSLSKDLTGGASLLFYDAGTFELNTESGASSTVSAQRDYLFGLSGAYRLPNNSALAFGANLKFLYSTLLAQYSAFAAAVDLGANWTLEKWQFGLALKNLGTPMKYIDAADPLPSYALLGAGFNVYQDKTFSILLAADTIYDWDSDFRLNLGTEIGITELLAIRGGYKINSDISSLTIGAGFSFKNFQLDYTFSPMQVLNSTHLVSLKYTIAPLAEIAAAAPEVQEPFVPENVEAKASGPVEKVPAQILEIRKSGGRASEVVMNVGADKGIKVGYEGVILDASGLPLAALVIRMVEPALSLAEVIGLSRDIEDNATAYVEIPKTKK